MFFSLRRDLFHQPFTPFPLRLLQHLADHFGPAELGQFPGRLFRRFPGGMPGHGFGQISRQTHRRAPLRQRG